MKIESRKEFIPHIRIGVWRRVPPFFATISRLEILPNSCWFWMDEAAARALNEGLEKASGRLRAIEKPAVDKTSVYR
jgi:hypothetical protein